MAISSAHITPQFHHDDIEVLEKKMKHHIYQSGKMVFKMNSRIQTNAAWNSSQSLH